MKNYHEIRARLERIKSDLEVLHPGKTFEFRVRKEKLILVQSKTLSNGRDTFLPVHTRPYDPETKTDDPADRLRAELELDREVLKKHFYEVELVEDSHDNFYLQVGHSEGYASGRVIKPKIVCDISKINAGDPVYIGPDGTAHLSVGAVTNHKTLTNDSDPEPETCDDLSNSNSYDNVMARAKRVRDALTEARQCPDTSYAVETAPGDTIRVREYLPDGHLRSLVCCWTYDEPEPVPPRGRLIICRVWPIDRWGFAISSGETDSESGKLKVFDKFGRFERIDYLGKHWYDPSTGRKSPDVEMSEIPKDLLELAEANAKLST